MQRISVDLPDPDGPQTTMRSPRATLRSMSLSTWKSPNHLPRFSIRIAGASPGEAVRAAGAGGDASVMAVPSVALAAREIVFEPLAVLRHPEAEDPVDDDREQERLD